MSETAAPADGPLFADLDADDPEKGMMEMDSLCPNCHEQGRTRMMLTRIPYFRELIISSFLCEECNHENRHVQFAGRIQDKGIKYTVTVRTKRDLDRQVIRSDSASMTIPELELGNPPGKFGEITNIEGLLDAVVRGLNQEQPLRKAIEPDLAMKIDHFIVRLEKLKDLGKPFTLEIDDPSGNSYIENPSAPHPDPGLKVTEYIRTRKQDQFLGLVQSDDEEEDEQEEEQPADSGGATSDGNSQLTTVVEEDTETTEETDSDKTDFKTEVLSFAVNCPSCNAPCQTNMKMIDIPFFKEVVLMATTCDGCGHRENQVKGGSGISDLGTIITLKVTDPADLNRDVLKSDTCGVRIPEIELELVEGTLGGRFTTVEGLLVQVRDELQTKNPFFMGDSTSSSDMKQGMAAFITKLDRLITGEVGEFTFILDDPAGNSYLQNLYAPDPDPEMTVEHYTRSHDQNDTLGILQMNTENYLQNDS